MKKKNIRFNLIERKGNNRPLRFINAFMTGSLLLWSVTATAQRNITKSPALERLLQQIEQNYVPQQWNQGMDDIAITVPFLYVQLVGYAMYNQQNNINQSSSGLKEFNNLNQEIISLTPQIAKAYNTTNSNNINFEFCNPEELQVYYIKSKNGILSQNFIQHYREQAGKDITQINIPFILDEGAEPLYIKAPRKDDAIVLLGEEVRPESSIRALEGPLITGLKCPLRSDKFLQIDTNDNPDDKTCIKCYYDNGLLSKQVPVVNNYEHGEYFYYWTWGNEPHHLITRGFYNNGKKHDIWEEYRYGEEAGKALLAKRMKYDSGIEIFEEEYWRKKPYLDVYRRSSTLYVKGERSETTWFYENGRKRMHVSIIDGESVKDGCWEEDGTPISCPSFW